MERRTFLKILSSAGIVSLVSPTFAMEVCKNKVSKSSSALLESAFRNPPFSSGVYTWWHWMNGNITKDGITRDLEAMKANGIAGYQLFEAGSGIPIGPVESLSDEWVGSYSAYAQRIRKVGFGVCNAQLPRLVIQWWSVDHSR